MRPLQFSESWSNGVKGQCRRPTRVLTASPPVAGGLRKSMFTASAKAVNAQFKPVGSMR